MATMPHRLHVVRASDADCHLPHPESDVQRSVLRRATHAPHVRQRAHQAP
jgi:hypothetical protein